MNQQIALEQHELNKHHQLGLQEDSPTRGSRRGRRPELPSKCRLADFEAECASIHGVSDRGSYGTPDRHDFDGRGARASMGREQGRQQGAQAHVQESVSKFKQPALSQVMRILDANSIWMLICPWISAFGSQQHEVRTTTQRLVERRWCWRVDSDSESRRVCDAASVDEPGPVVQIDESVSHSYILIESVSH